MRADLIETAKGLPLPERIELLDALWESIIEDGYEPALTNDQAEELDRRLEAHRQDPDDVIDWETIQTQLKAKNGSD